MSERNEKILQELSKRQGNDVCADCRRKSKPFSTFVDSYLLATKLLVANQRDNAAPV